MRRLAKRAVKSGLRPVTERFFSRVEQRLTPIAAGARTLRGELATLRGHLPALLNTIGAQKVVNDDLRRAAAGYETEAAALRAARADAAAELAQLSVALDRLSAVVEGLVSQSHGLRDEILRVADAQAAAAQGRSSARLTALERRADVIHQELLFAFRARRPPPAATALPEPIAAG